MSCQAAMVPTTCGLSTVRNHPPEVLEPWRVASDDDLPQVGAW